MVCALPFRPRYSLAPRVFEIRTTQGLSTNPALVLSRTCTPPQGLALTIVAHLRKRGRPCLPTKSSSRHSSALQHVQAGKPFLSLGFGPSVRKALPCFPKVPPPGFGYPHGGVSLSRPRKLFSAFHAHGLHSSGLCSGSAACDRFPCHVPPLRFSAKPFGLATALRRFALTEPTVPSAPRLCFKPG
jgi:hypothetical protein